MAAHATARAVRLFLLIEVLLFAAASIVHAGALGAAYAHRQARIAETVIGLVLLAALVVALVRPSWTRRTGLVAQGFALLGTIVGAVMIAIGVGPRTAPDIVYHVVLLVLLGWGLAAAARMRPAAGGNGSGGER